MSFIINPYRFAGVPVISSPSDLSGLDLLMDPETISAVDNTAVVDWADASGVGSINYGQNTGSAQPTLKTNIVNGHSVVRFGGDDKLVVDPTGRTLSTDNTLILVCKPGTVASYMFGTNGSNGGPAFISKFNPGTGVKDLEYFRVSTERETFAASASGFHILTVTHTDNVGNYVGYLDGTQVFSDVVDVNQDWSGITITEIGANGVAVGNDFYTGDIAYFLHYNVNYDGTGSLTALHNWLKTRFAI